MRLLRIINRTNTRLIATLVAFALVCGIQGQTIVYSEEAENPSTADVSVTTRPVTTTRGVVTTTKAVVTTDKKVVKKKAKKKVQLKRPKVKVKSRLEKKVRISWKKVKNAKYYLVYRKVKGKKYKRIKKTSRKVFKDKKAKKRTKYYYKVVACRKISGKVYKSKKSKSVKVFVKAKKTKSVSSKAEVVICGECYVEGMAVYAKNYLPSNYRLVYKVGISTYGLLNTNYINYNGMTITAIERIAYYRPKRVFFLDGMNEASNPNPTSTINNYKKMISLLKSVNPNVEIVIMALPPVARSHVSGFANNPSINKYNAAYKKLAKNTKNVYYYSGYRKLITDKDGYLKAYANGGDGGHWSYQATIDVFKKIKKYSDKLAKEKR